VFVEVVVAVRLEGFRGGVKVGLFLGGAVCFVAFIVEEILPVISGFV
jgi:hypothetical protein